MQPIDVEELRGKVKDVYQQVADRPDGEFHFEMGRDLALRLGYDAADLDGVPEEAVQSFAGVGFHFDLASLRPGEAVLDAGSGSGMDSFVAARKVGPGGTVVGIDMTDEQLAKATRLAKRDGFAQATFRHGYLETLPIEDATFDVVISNGVINLTADKAATFRELARVLKPGGRLALSDIVTEKPLTESIKCDTSLWAACIGGAAQVDDYRGDLAAAGLRIAEQRDNPDYAFLSTSAQGASRDFGVKSVSLVAVREN
ncbi:MAG: methyltransferase domain-containing protein [Trueperaceae bacterium]